MIALHIRAASWLLCFALGICGLAAGIVSLWAATAELYPLAHLAQRGMEWLTIGALAALLLALVL